MSVPSRYDARRPTVSATIPVGTSNSTIPTVKNALAANRAVGPLLARRAQAPRAGVWAVVLCNALWVVDSVLLLALGWVSPTALGSAFVLAQATAVAVFALAQYAGLQRHHSAAAA